MSEPRQYVTVDEMAEMHDMSTTNVYIILRADQKLPLEQRRLPGAEKVGDTFRGEWRIPRDVAEKFQRSTRGRKSDKE